MQQIRDGGRISDVILGALFSLALYGLITKGIDWGAESCPFDTNNTKLVIYVLILVITTYLLFLRKKF